MLELRTAGFLSDDDSPSFIGSAGNTFSFSLPLHLCVQTLWTLNGVNISPIVSFVIMFTVYRNHLNCRNLVFSQSKWVMSLRKQTQQELFNPARVCCVVGRVMSLLPAVVLIQALSTNCRNSGQRHHDITHRSLEGQCEAIIHHLEWLQLTSGWFLKHTQPLDIEGTKLVKANKLASVHKERRNYILSCFTKQPENLFCTLAIS